MGHILIFWIVCVAVNLILMAIRDKEFYAVCKKKVAEKHPELATDKTMQTTLRVVYYGTMTIFALMGPFATVGLLFSKPE